MLQFSPESHERLTLGRLASAPADAGLVERHLTHFAQPEVRADGKTSYFEGAGAETAAEQEQAAGLSVTREQQAAQTRRANVELSSEARRVRREANRRDNLGRRVFVGPMA